MFRIEGFDHLALTVRDMERSLEWYQDVLGLERRFEDSWGNYPAVVCAGSTCLAFFPRTKVEPQTKANSKAGLRHFAFRVDRKNFEQAKAELKHRGIDFHFEDHDIAHSIYFRDPDDYEVELTTYEL